MILPTILALVLSIFVLIPLYNLYTAPVLKNHRVQLQDKPQISVLIPARNEELNIKKVLQSLVKQSYQNLEIILLDDDSTDRTYEYAQSFTDKINLKVLKGKEKPAGWIGKNWACQQLSEAASGAFLLFIDADIWLNEHAISNAYATLQSKNAKMLSSFSTQYIGSFGEYLMVPLMNWLLLTFLPLKLVYKSPRTSFVAANGQFLLFERNAYISMGRHKRVKNKVVEDMEIARLLKDSKVKIITTLGGDAVFCRMYKGFNEAFSGFSKNFFLGFNTSTLLFSTFLIFNFLVFLLPILFFLLKIEFSVIVLIIILNRIFISVISKQNIFLNLILHPAQMLLLIVLGIRSIYLFKIGNISWKGRKIERQK